MGQIPRSTSADPPTGDTENWSAGQPEEPYGARYAPPVERVWDPGPAPWDTPGFEPVAQAPGGPYPPPLGLQVMPAAPTNGIAIASLIFGILGWVLIPVVAPLLAVILGHVARGQIRYTGERGSGMALAGLALGYVNLALALVGILILGVIVLIAAAASGAAGG